MLIPLHELFGEPATRANSRWTERPLGSGLVSTPRHARTEAHVWAREAVATGKLPPFDHVEWRETAARLLLTPEQEQDGWRYIERVFVPRFLKTRQAAEMAVSEAMGSFTSQPYKGYSLQLPQMWLFRTPRMAGDAPAWPFRTKAADRIYRAARVIVRAALRAGKHPTVQEMSLSAMNATNLSPLDIPAEDESLLSMAIQWCLQGKDADPEPPKIPVQRTPFGMKGTQTTTGTMTPRSTA